ncbi:hypothetical protein [Vibrio vulnificus]|uniref:hypothetical protein n=1 Tax=Vibrio vulnificus TaxID=672 RepID=UPI001F4F95D4|nr:hypothetical protein [Vibrio vulnificus]MCU8150817.1 hypothetical protein [Vibrio vulnificus]MCU8256253.1 hypothetical protein [Vibrio vulnificus]MCU8453032.1 hypothetical protein [Vibrio vulnificus]
MDEKVQIAFGVWAGVSLLGYVLFYANKNTQFKRKYYPAFCRDRSFIFVHC